MGIGITVGYLLNKRI